MAALRLYHSRRNDRDRDYEFDRGSFVVCSFVMPNTHRRRRRVETRQFRHVGVGGVYWALVRILPPATTAGGRRAALCAPVRDGTPRALSLGLILVNNFDLHFFISVSSKRSYDHLPIHCAITCSLESRELYCSIIVWLCIIY